MSEYIAEMKNINKSFSGVKVLDDVDFNLKSGEVLALLGENGAGKSTLMKILSGVYTRDSGDVTIFGKSYGDLTPKQAQEIGVAIIHQELNMCQHLSIAENIFLAREIKKNGMLDKTEMNKQAKEILARLHLDIDPTILVGDLSVSKQQMVEIAKALSLDAKILIMDEPTSALTSREIQELFKVIHDLKATGCGIVYISHRLEELQHIVDRAQILRDGKYITTLNFADTNLDEIISNMVGREIKEKFPQVETELGDVIFEVKNLNAGHLVRDINLTLRAGEIVGIAGLMGAGRTETTRAIFGVDHKTSGSFYLDGEEITINRPIDAIKHGIFLAPEDRKKDGLLTKLSITDNLALPNLSMLSNALGVMSASKQKVLTQKAIEDLHIRLATPLADAGTLSGGNQQKVVVAKWLARESRAVIFDEPTRGIDVAAKVEIYNIMNQLKQDGVAVLFVSSELPEVLGIADRIIVMCDGRITGEMPTAEATQDKIMRLATQFEDKATKEASA